MCDFFFFFVCHLCCREPSDVPPRSAAAEPPLPLWPPRALPPRWSVRTRPSRPSQSWKLFFDYSIIWCKNVYFTRHNWNKCVFFFFLSLCVVRGRCVCGFKCGPRVRTKLQPNSAKPSAASLGVWRTRPRCCPLGEPAGLHKGAPEMTFSFFTFPLLYFPPPPLLSCPLTGCKVSSCIIIDIYHVTKRRVLVHMLISHQRHGFWKSWCNCRIHHLVDSWVNTRSKQSYIPAFMLLNKVPDPDLWKNHPALSCNSVFLEKH